MGLLLLCSCATTPDSSAPTPKGVLPSQLKMNRDAGRGNWLLVTVGLENGEQLLFKLDTGASITCFDKTLEPTLGKCLGTCVDWRFGDKADVNVYVAPKLYLRGSLLQTTTTNIITLDLEKSSSDTGYPIKGILGMDVLQHYCIQLDFAANRIRFLDKDHTHRKAWGTPFSLADNKDACPIVSENLTGGKVPGSLIDSGYSTDGWLAATSFDQWTNRALPATNGEARFPNGLLDGEMYPQVDLDRLDPNVISSGDPYMKFNGIGLRFLGRHLVTFDFPNRTMYLKRTSVSPLSLKSNYWKPVAKSAYRFLHSLKRKGQLPGWSKTDSFPKTMTFHTHSLGFGALEFLKKGDSSVYHYQVTRVSEDSPWKLQKAWRTDQHDLMIEEYIVL